VSVPRRVLITGASGLVGSRLALAGRERGDEVLGTYAARPWQATGIRTEPMDLRNPAAMHALVLAHRPEVISHAAAVADPDACARDPLAARAVNVEGTRHVALAAAACGARVVLASTDLVYDGERGWYEETDPPGPLGAYARSKVEAEQVLLEHLGERACVARIGLVYGFGAAHGRSFAERWVGGLRRGERLAAFTDQFRTPILIDDLCAALLEMPESALSGLYHVAGPERASRHDFALALCEAFSLDRGLVRPGRVAEVAFLDPRSRDVSLRCERLRREIEFAPSGIREGLARMRESEHR
jgi:dTDP-4-dehydrorhamnose reductase